MNIERKQLYDYQNTHRHPQKAQIDKINNSMKELGNELINTTVVSTKEMDRLQGKVQIK